MLNRCHAAVLVLPAVLLSVARAGSGQVADFESRCIQGADPHARALCGDLADALEILLSRTAIVATGGSPVAGTASTLGHRTPGAPRIAVTARAALAGIEVPQLQTASSRDVREFTATAWSVDLAMGLVQGLAIFPTVGGFGSLDVFGSAGIVQLPAGEVFRSRAPGTWSAGLRLGILQESFNAPGLSVSAQYRRIGAWNLGDVRLRTGDAYLRVDAASIWSVRGTVGKRIALFGLTAGAGFDGYRADIVARVPGASGEPSETRLNSYTGDRTNVFGSASWTLLVVTFVAEAGWQADADDAAQGRLRPGGLWGGLGARLTF
jgi:hypothetical protein